MDTMQSAGAAGASERTDASAGDGVTTLELSPVERRIVLAALHLFLDAEDDPETIEQVQALLGRLGDQPSRR